MASNLGTQAINVRAIAPGSVKVCGIRAVEHALAAADAGADLIGMIFAPARRQVTVEVARLIANALHAAHPGVRLVGVFVDATPAEINLAAEAAGLDLVQLNGDETPEVVARIDRGVIKAFRPRPGEAAAALAGRIGSFLAAPKPPIAVLIDGYDPHAHGGTGVRADWHLVAQLSDRLGQSVGLAGGLTPANVGAAIGQVRPLFVDTSSGVERDGIKDVQRISDYVTAARVGFHDGVSD